MTLRFPPPKGDCWEWEGGTNLQGYGQVSAPGVKSAQSTGRIIPVHRLAYRLFKGPIPRGMEIDHLCRNRLCCNPSHLEAVTRTENIRRSPRVSNPPRYLDFDSRLLAKRLELGLSRDALAAMAGVSPWTIFNLERGFVTKPREGTAQRLSTALGVDPVDLFEAAS